MPRNLAPVVALVALALAACASSGAVAPAAAAQARPAPGADNAHAGHAPAHDPRLHASAPRPPALPSPITVPLDSATLAALPRHPVAASAHGQALRCEGVALLDLLRAAGAMPAEPLRGAQLTRYVQVDARDGYRALFSLAELDPTLGDNAVYVIDRCDGVALGADAGPLRLVAPGESRPARWVQQVDAITVIVAP